MESLLLDKNVENNSNLYNIELLELELIEIESHILKGDVKEAIKLMNYYSRKYTELKDKFILEFRELNILHNNIRNNIKSSSFDLNIENKEIYSRYQNSVLKNIKSSFQEKVIEKEKIINTYKILTQISEQKFNNYFFG